MSKIALVVDDSKSARFALRKFLEGFNYKVETAESASDAYRILGGMLPELIFMDHMMPGVDGFEALRVLKSDARTAQVPIVICSSNEGEDFIAQAKTHGALNVLQKPPSSEQLAGLLANLARRTADDSEPLHRDLSAMKRLMATIPPKMMPGAQVLSASMPQPGQLEDISLLIPGSLSTTLPLPTMVIPPPTASKVQSLREPSVTIQQAVMRSIRDSLPQEPAQSSSASAVSPLHAGAAAISALREEMDTRIDSLKLELRSELDALRAQLSGFSGNALDEKLQAIANEAAKARSNALASSLEQHLSALRGNLDAILRAQNERIEQLLQISRQTAAEEAERMVMKAAQRISDQMAESILKTLGPQLANMRRL